MYTCGPTVYADAHIGNFRTYIFEDLLRRTLKLLGYRVIQVMNLTDVDDKTIRESRSAGISLQEHTAPIIERFFADLDNLNIERAEYYPAATEHIPEMIRLVDTLLDKGYAYKMSGSVYFSIEKFREYGRLSGMKLDRLKRGARIDADEYEKDDFRDFALWRGWTEDDGDIGWDAPFGRGRPGWHIECSSMSMKYLGEEFDIHTGGVDNIFPHHENEMAQSAAATGKGFVRYWLHSAHLVIDGEKMSKSLGNYYTLKDLLARGYSARSIRYALLTTHYRQRLNLSDDVIKAASSAIERLDTLRFAAEEASGEGETGSKLLEAIETSQQRFTQSLEDNLGISGAMAAVFDLVSAVHRISLEKSLNGKEGSMLLSFWKDIDSVLGLLFPAGVELPQNVREIVNERAQVRREKNFKRSDEIRDALLKDGYLLEDTKDGTIVIWKEGRELVK